MAPIIQVNNIAKKYKLNGAAQAHTTLRDQISGLFTKKNEQIAGSKDFWALNDVSFEMNEGEVLGIIGRNGAGKSTLLKILSRITAPTRGEAILNGRVGSLLEVGTGFHPELSGRENVYFNGTILGMSKREIDARFDEIVDFSGIEKFIDTPIKRYSSGMKMRLAFSVAAHLDSEILIVDEVLAVGDVNFQEKCLGKMRDVSNAGRTVLFVSHNLSTVRQLCNRVLLLSGGQVIEDTIDVGEGIQQYISQNDVTNSTAKILPKHYSMFTLSKFYTFKGDSSSQCKRFNSSDQIGILLEIEVKNYNVLLNFGIYVSDIYGNEILISLSTDGPKQTWPINGNGLFKIVTYLPSNVFNAGRYSINFISSIHNQKWISAPEDGAVTNIIEIEFNDLTSPYWNSRRIGLLAPRVYWKAV